MQQDIDTTSINLDGWRGVKGVRGALYRIDQFQKRTSFAWRAAANYMKVRSGQIASRPPVTAVVVGRNDDYMPDFFQRLQATISWNAHYLADEIIFVEWNPPPERELLSVQLAKQFPFLRAYVVAPEIHAVICENPRVAVLEFHAKNVGLRRAATDWVLATNADAAFGLDTVRTILQTQLAEDVVWTTQRVDIPWREGKSGPMRLVDSLRYRRISPYVPLGTGEFALASRELWHRVRGYDESLVRHRIAVDIRGTAQMVAHGATTRKAGIVLHLSHPTSNSEGLQPHHGEWATLDGLPYCNAENWGLGNREEEEVAERVWLLK